MTDFENEPPFLAVDCGFGYASGFQVELKFESDVGVTAISGPSGCGKTTVLSLVAGLRRPQRGVIRIADQFVVDTEKRKFVAAEKRRVGILFQDQCLFPHLTVARNIAYGQSRTSRVLRSRSRKQDQGDSNQGQENSPVDIQPINVASVVEMLELTPLLNRFPHQLSGGEKQRVALARALAANPSLLLLDEPLTAVDEPLRKRIADFIADVVETCRVPTILVSHNRELVERLAQRVICMESGRLVL